MLHRIFTGVAAAAQTYFNKTLGELEPHEAAMLAAMPQAPSKYHPVHAKERVTQRRNYVLRRMWDPTGEKKIVGFVGRLAAGGCL